MILQNDGFFLQLNDSTGAIEGLTSKKTGWEVIGRQRLGASFRLMVPIDGRRNNLVHGEKQQASSVMMNEAGSEVTYFFDGVVSQFAGELNIKVWMNVAMLEDQAVFTMTIQNDSPYTVENVYAPCLGDVKPPEGAKRLDSLSCQHATARVLPVWPTFQINQAYWGVDFPTQFNGNSPSAPFCLLKSENEGFYAGVRGQNSELISWKAELHPGYGDSIETNVPVPEEIDGQDVFIRFEAAFVPYIMPGEKRELTPIAIAPYVGQWQAGVDLYRAWRKQWSAPQKAPEWVLKPHSWIQIHINSPEDELRIAFKDLPRVVGQACRDAGVSAIQLVGWNDGGQDQGYPSHSPDPRLGTFEELRQAINEIHAMGVKVVLFTKFTWADRALPWFRQTLKNYAVRDPYGDYYMHPGYAYQTASSLLNVNTKRLIPMCFYAEEYLKICEDEFQKVLDLGADGMLFDECVHHGPAYLCFDTAHGHRYGAPIYAMDREFLRRLQKKVPAGKEFLMAGEVCYDWELEDYTLSYHRSDKKDHLPMTRYLRPDRPLITAVIGFADRDLVNQALLYKYILSYEPYNFKGLPQDYPVTLAYGQKMDALRRAYQAYLWDGEYLHQQGAAIQPENQGTRMAHSVFMNREDGSRAVVIVNSERTPVKVALRLDFALAKGMYRLVDDETLAPFTGEITIPAKSAAVVL